jgi:hypothetical protein
MAPWRPRGVMGVGCGHPLGLAVAHPLPRARCRPRRAPWRGERRLDGRGPTAVALLGQPSALGHDDLVEAWGRGGRGGAGASDPRGAPGGSPPWVAPPVRAGPCPAEVRSGVAGQVAVDDPSHDLAQTLPMLRGQRGPALRPRHLLGARGWGGTQRPRRGGAWSGVPRRQLLTARQADVDTTATAAPTPIPSG